MAQELFIDSLFNDANLVSYWRMEGNSNDSKGSNNGTDTAITYNTSNGKFNQGAGLNGTTSNISLADSASLSITGNISIMFWAKFPSLPISGSDNAFFTKWNYGGSGQNSYSYEIYANPVSGNYDFYQFVSGNGTNVDAHLKTLPSLDTNWHHYAMSTTIASHATEVFFDGISLGVDSSGSITSIFDGNLAAKVGKFSDAHGYLNGYMDDIALFNRALTAAEILAFYNRPSGSALMSFMV